MLPMAPRMTAREPAADHALGPTSCEACGAAAIMAPWAGTGPDGSELRRCTRCQLTWSVPRLTADELANWYPPEYYGPQGSRFRGPMEWLVAWFRRRRAARLSRHVRPGRVLDIGCGRGLTLAALRARGWQVTGVELNAAAARSARELLAIDVRVGPFEARQFGPASFDAVVVWHVLEHLPEAPRVLAEIAGLIRPGGALLLAVPNLASWQARLARYAWFHLDLPRHRYHFSARWLRCQLAALGLRVVDERHASAEQNVFGWVQSALNVVGLPHNLLYDILRRRGSRTIGSPWQAHPWASLLSVIGLVLLLPPAAMLLVAESLLRVGATVEMVAIKDEP